MTQMHPNFETLLATAHDLDITIITGQVGPPIHGRMWIGGRALDAILCPNGTERKVAIMIVPSGSSETSIHLGKRTLNTTELARFVENGAAAGGNIIEGWLAVLTPALWLERYPRGPATGSGSATLAAAIAAGWPAIYDDHPALFLGVTPLSTLFAQANAGRAVTLLVATLATLPHPVAEQPAIVPLLQHAPARAPQRQHTRAGAIRVIQQDAWERPRNPDAPAPTTREPAIGDRVVIQQGRRTIPAFLGQIGTVVQLFRVPRDSCLVRVDGDRAGQPELFCYHDEVALYEV
ncbi:hypothetical protein SE17_13895 [Kouleothrix aurantiaca]|uniref:Uncharacterized protein n=1 Tax=Kouleothrix aurantiaca TaxID=186479 RepID=A0A0P9D3Z1_9CHLR|nr:hypothetical protein SE17_13895 [Kouleothrix aurantiaca]